MRARAREIAAHVGAERARRARKRAAARRAPSAAAIGRFRSGCSARISTRSILRSISGEQVDRQIRADAARVTAVVASYCHNTQNAQSHDDLPAVTITLRGQHDIVKAHRARFAAVRLWHVAPVRRHSDGAVAAPCCALRGPCDDARPTLRSRPLSRLRPRAVAANCVVGDVYRVSSPEVCACSIATSAATRGKPRFVRARCIVSSRAACAERLGRIAMLRRRRATRISSGDYRVYRHARASCLVIGTGTGTLGQSTVAIWRRRSRLSVCA